MVARGIKIGVAIFTVVALLGVASAGYLATSAEQPTVEESELAWGEVTDDTTEISTEIVVNNPNSFGVPGLIDLSYTATLNDVTLANGRESGVGLDPGTNRLALSTEMQNDRIADWWVTHVNSGERSTMKIDATVGAAGFSRTIPVKEDTIETDILGGFTDEERSTITVQDDPFLRVSDQTAEWGTATNESTPITFGSTIQNVHDYPVTLQGVEYVVVMNGVELGNNQIETGVDVPPGETDQLDVTVQLDTPKMADWWAEHVRDREESNLSVQMYGIVEKDGQRERVPIRLYDETIRLETDILGNNGTSVANVPGQRAQGVTFPEITDSSRQWGDVTQETTEIRGTSTINASDNNMTRLLTLDLAQQTTINDIEVANDSARIDDLSPGRNQVSTTAELDNSLVPDWWARHLNQGETSTVLTTPTAVADIGFTKFDVAMEDQRSTFGTDLLSGMNGQVNEEISIEGRRALVFNSVSADWGTATPQTAPINVQADVDNELPVNVEITEVRYTVTLNDVVLADKTARNVDTLSQGSNTLDLTMDLDNQKMDEWWVTHVPEEQSQLDITVEVTADSRAGSTTQEIDALGQSETIETDILGADS